MTNYKYIKICTKKLEKIIVFNFNSNNISNKIFFIKIIKKYKF